MLKQLISKVYGFFVGKRNDNYDNNKEIIKCRVPVISVGNLSVGGTGKTPFVQMLTKYFISKGFKPGIVGKGYKRESRGEVIVGDGKKVLVNAATGGDEMVLLADSLNVPVIAHDSKTEAALSMQKNFDVDLIIVDDGFQHRRLHRDLDIVLIDKETHDNPQLIPEGRLREPVDSLKRADIICTTGNFELSSDFKEQISDGAIRIRVRPVQANPYYLHDKLQVKIRESKKHHIHCIAFAGIAKPNRFYDMLKELGYTSLTTHSFSDHHNYKKDDLALLIKLCREKNINLLATTEKDAAKIIEYNDLLLENDIKCLVFPIALTITDGKVEFFKMIGGKINKIIYNNRKPNDVQFQK